MKAFLPLVMAFLLSMSAISQEIVPTEERVHWRKVRLYMDDYEEARDIRTRCTFITNVENRFSGGTPAQAQKRLLRQAGNRGANFVVLHRASTEGKEWAKALFTGYTVTGEAYKC